MANDSKSSCVFDDVTDSSISSSALLQSSENSPFATNHKFSMVDISDRQFDVYSIGRQDSVDGHEVITKSNVEIKFLDADQLSDRDAENMKVIANLKNENSILKDEFERVIRDRDAKFKASDKLVSNQRMTISNLKTKMANMVTKEWHHEAMNDYVLAIISEHNANLKTWQLDDGKNKYVEEKEFQIVQHSKEIDVCNSIISNQRTVISMLKSDLFSFTDIHNAQITQRDRMILDLKNEIASLRGGMKTVAGITTKQSKPCATIKKPPKTPIRQLKSNCSKVMRVTKETLWTKPIAKFNHRPLSDPTNEWENYNY
jgi:hypothetical protein